MSSMYPSLEDMKASEMIHAQIGVMQPPQQQHTGNVHYSPSAPVPTLARSSYNAYPSLHDFMGLELTEEMIRSNMPEYLDPPSNHQSAGYGGGAIALQQPNTIVPARNNAGVGIVAPISGSVAVVKSMVTHGVRHITIVKESGKIGLRVVAKYTGVFVCLVTEGSPASRATLRFGDQILQIDGIDMAGLSVEKVHNIFKKKNSGQSFLLAVRDRPFERSGDGKIVNIVKDSSASRNGLLTDHNLLEINGKNVVGLKDKEITKVIGSVDGHALNVTIMPSFLYQHMVKEMASGLFGKMDHSNPEF